MPVGVYKRTRFHREINRIAHLGQISWNTGKKLSPLTEKHKKKISKALQGHKTSDETRKKISKANKGRPSLLRGVPRTEEVKQKISKSNLGKFPSKESKAKMSSSKKGKHSSPSTEFKKGSKAPTTAFKRSDPRLVGSNNPNWKNGITPINNKIRTSYDYRLWEKNVFAHDNYVCKRCDEDRAYKLVAHHVKNFAQYPKLRFKVKNGITLCRDCHKEFHRRYGRKDNTQKQITIFLKE